MAFLEQLAAGLSGFGAGVQDPSFAMKQAAELRRQEEEKAKRSKLMELAKLQDPQAILQGAAQIDPKYLTQLATYQQDSDFNQAVRLFW